MELGELKCIERFFYFLDTIDRKETSFVGYNARVSDFPTLLQLSGNLLLGFLSRHTKTGWRHGDLDWETRWQMN